MTRTQVFFALLALVAAQRIVELWLSRRHLARLVTSPSRGDIAFAGGARDWTAMVAVHVAFFVLPAIEVLWRGARGPSVLAWIAVLAFAAAQALRVWTFVTLGELWNARAAVDPTRGFVANGPYRFLRHPNYLVVAVEFLTLPLFAGAWISWIVLNAANAIVLARRIAAEDRLLARIPGYVEAMGHKGALWPRIGTARAAAVARSAPK
jgi:methyltransferase